LDKNIRVSSVLVALALTLGAAACSSSSSSPASTGATATTSTSGAGGATGGTGGGSNAGGSGGGQTGTGGGSGGALPSCAGPGHSTNPAKQDVGKVTVNLVDLDGAPAAGVEVYVCGIDLCTDPKKTDANGSAALDATGLPMKKAAFKFGDGWQWGKFAQPLDPSQKDFNFDHAVAPKLPADGAVLAAGKTATSGGASITVDAVASVTFDELTYDTPEKQQFRAVRVPADKAPPGVDATLNLEILYAAGPISTVLCPAAKLSVPNDAGWDAGADVELWVHGADGATEEWAPYASWVKVGEGKVSADGKTVETTDGKGLPVVATFGFKKK
jgi:hypothetical protein